MERWSPECGSASAEPHSGLRTQLPAFASPSEAWLPLSSTGLLHVRQAPHLNCLASNLPDHKDLAFKLKRKQFAIEVRCCATPVNMGALVGEDVSLRRLLFLPAWFYFCLLLAVKIKGETIDYTLLLSRLLWCDVRKQQGVNNNAPSCSHSLLQCN